MFDETFDPAYFDALVFASGGFGPMADSPYFECDYFDETYFDTDCTEPVAGEGRRAVRIIRRPEPLDDDELMLLT